MSGDVERLFWAVGEARRLRLEGEHSGVRPAGRDLAGSTSPARSSLIRRDGITRPPPAPTTEGLSVAALDGGDQLTVLGQLGAISRKAFLRGIDALVAKGARSVVVDLGGAEVDSSGVAALALALEHVEGCEVQLVLKSAPRDTLELLREAALIDRFSVR